MEEIYFFVGHSTTQTLEKLYGLHLKTVNLNCQICSQGEEQTNNKHNSEFCVLLKYHKYKHFSIILGTENMNCAQKCHNLKKDNKQI